MRSTPTGPIPRDGMSSLSAHGAAHGGKKAPRAREASGGGGGGGVEVQGAGWQVSLPQAPPCISQVPLLFPWP